MTSASQDQPALSPNKMEVQKFFRRLGLNLCDWQPLATECDFDLDRIKAIEKEFKNKPSEQVFHMLCLLWQRNPEDWATVLMNGLNTVGRNDLVGKVKRFLNGGRTPLKPVMSSTNNMASCTSKRSSASPVAPARTRRRTSDQAGPSTTCTCSRGMRQYSIPQIKLKMPSNWCTEFWKNRMYKKPQRCRKAGHTDTFYFHTTMTDRSGINIYTSFFLKDKQKCKEIYEILLESGAHKPVCLGSLRVERQPKKYHTANGSKYKLVFNEDSQIQN